MICFMNNVIGPIDSNSTSILSPMIKADFDSTPFITIIGYSMILKMEKATVLCKKHIKLCNCLIFNSLKMNEYYIYLLGYCIIVKLIILFIFV